MKRTFNTHRKRQTLTLDGEWKFVMDPQNVGEGEKWYIDFPQDAKSITVPGCWNTELGKLNYMGVCWYKRDFFLCGDDLRDLLLSFESVMTRAKVYLDGALVGSHDGGFSPFDIIVSDISAGDHTIVLRVDSKQDEKSIPQTRVDWFNYGGIARSVSAESLRGLCVISSHLIYSFPNPSDLTLPEVSLEVELYNASSKSISDTLDIRLGDIKLNCDTIQLDARQRKIVRTPSQTLSGIKPWSCESPTLYTLQVSTSSDDLIDRVGFRLIEVKEGKLLLNGKTIELRGVNRHEEHPDWGFAFPQGLMRRDLDLIEELGCNTIRGSHYPQSKIFLDMLDERGILFWSEIPIWGGGFSEKALQDEDIVELGLTMHKEMCYYYYNHPSIIIWGMHNEVYQYPCVYEISRKYHELLRANGGNRLITHASMFPNDDPSLEFDDIICINHYKGWYGGGNGGYLNDWKNMIDEFRACREKRGMADKPVIFSEFGAAALAGFHSHFDSVKWSEEYQAQLLKYCLTLFHDDPMIQGFYVWQFANIRTYAEMDLNRVRCFNNKGIVDEYRNPKSAFFAVRELYHKFKSEEQK
ncbi:MAG: beta-glucuronidase [Clostridia bacterium]|nr:beta-glucuronidase [Clostridia bacterium]